MILLIAIITKEQWERVGRDIAMDLDVGRLLAHGATLDDCFGLPHEPRIPGRHAKSGEGQGGWVGGRSQLASNERAESGTPGRGSTTHILGRTSSNELKREQASNTRAC